MRCPTCQADSPAQNKICGECGARLRLTCPGGGHLESRRDGGRQPSPCLLAFLDGLHPQPDWSAPKVSLAYCREAVAIAEAEGFDDVRAFAECRLAHVYLTAGELRDAVVAGERALVFFESRGGQGEASDLPRVSS